jgi:hypothetical protein
VSKPKVAGFVPDPRSASPVAPEYSPITPKVQPVLPATAFVPPPENGGTFTFSMAEPDVGEQPKMSIQQAPARPAQPAQSVQPAQPIQQQMQQPQIAQPVKPLQQQEQQLQQQTKTDAQKQQPPQQPPQQPIVQQSQPQSAAPAAAKHAISKADYIPQPPNRPFSSEDATDAMALRAAISTLQFQKKKAQNDMQELARIKQMALDDPERFKKELAAGRLKEERHVIGNMQSILDDLENGDDDDEVVFEMGPIGHKANEQARKISGETATSQPPRSDSVSTTKDVSMEDLPVSAQQAVKSTETAQPFPRIPEAQNIVRMPCVNWDKYGIVGEPLERIHNQQKRWPGATAGANKDRGREHAVAAPYSPFLDRIEPSPPSTTSRVEIRKDSAAVSPGTVRASNGSSS